jgi:hypothetical protein
LNVTISSAIILYLDLSRPLYHVQIYRSKLQTHLAHYLNNLVWIQSTLAHTSQPRFAAASGPALMIQKLPLKLGIRQPIINNKQVSGFYLEAQDNFVLKTCATEM